MINYNLSSIIPIIVVVIIMSKIRRLISVFRITGTTSSQNAKTLDDLNIKSNLIFRRLLMREVIIAVGEYKYYLSEENLIKYNKRRQRIVLSFIVILILILLICNIYLGR